MKHNFFSDCRENCFSNSHLLFKHLTSEEIEFLHQETTSEFHKRGSVIYHEGNRINGIYCISSGIIKIYKTGIDGKEQILRFAKKGDIIGFRSVLAKELACSTSEVISDAQTCYLPADILFDLIKQNGNFSLELMQLSCRELGEANSYITDIAQKTVRERLAEILIHLKEEFGINENNTLQISLTREELANIVGTATESVIRLLSEFKNDELIDLKGRNISLTNIPEIQKIANVF